MKFPKIKKIFDENDNIKFIDTKTLEYFAEYINKNEILSFDNLNNISNKINITQYLTNVKILFIYSAKYSKVLVSINLILSFSSKIFFIFGNFIYFFYF